MLCLIDVSVVLLRVHLKLPIIVWENFMLSTHVTDIWRSDKMTQFNSAMKLLVIYNNFAPIKDTY